jgi:hypothetical protein
VARGRIDVTEVARALAFPSTGFVKSDQLFSMLLVWDSVDLLPSQERYEDDDSPEAEVVRELTAEGLVCALPRPPDSEKPPATEKEAKERWQSIQWEHLAAANQDENFPASLAERIADGLIKDVFVRAHDFLGTAAALGVAPVALDPFAMKTVSLPIQDNSAPIREGTLIQAASRCVRVSAESLVEDVLSFREKNRPLMGQFRAALIDLSAAIQADSAVAASEQANAVFANRVEPALANLEAALSESRLKFAWSMLLGTSSVVLGGPAGPVAAALGAGSVLTRNLSYAFDKDRLVRDHPYGLLHRAGEAFEKEETRPSGPQITDPELEAKQWYQQGIERDILEAMKLRADYPASSGI